MNNSTAQYWIDKLELEQHPEGGYFSETYRSDENITELPGRYEGSRTYGTSIYFLLTTESVSNFHRLKSDEIWHYHQGGSAKIHIISPAGKLTSQNIGSDVENGEQLQVIIPRNSWFAAEVTREDFILVGCTVAPGFEFQDFQLAQRAALKKEYPKIEGLIERFTKN